MNKQTWNTTISIVCDVYKMHSLYIYMQSLLMSKTNAPMQGPVCLIYKHSPFNLKTKSFIAKLAPTVLTD